MSRKVGMGILRMIAVIGGVSILAVVVLTAGATLMPGTKVRKLFGASAEALAGDDPRYLSGKPVVMSTGADAGTDAGTGAPPGR